MTIAWEVAGATDVGRVRKGNEDSFRIDADRGVFLVADGMGGHAAGEVASDLAADTLVRRLASAGSTPTDFDRLILEGFREAQGRIVECCAGDVRTQGMGTTLTVALARPDGRLYIGHLGDSRAYRVREGRLEQLTQDHTWVQQEIDAGRLNGDAVRGHPLSHILTRVLTADEPSDPDLLTDSVFAGDRLLLCSDGLYNLIDDEEILEVLLTDASLREIVDRLIRSANRRGGNDNITAVLVRFHDAA